MGAVGRLLGHTSLGRLLQPGKSPKDKPITPSTWCLCFQEPAVLTRPEVAERSRPTGSPLRTEDRQPKNTSVVRVAYPRLVRGSLHWSSSRSFLLSQNIKKNVFNIFFHSFF